MNVQTKMPSASLAIAPITDADIAGVVALWQACGLTRPWNDPAADIALARRGPSSAVLVGRDAGAIVAAAQDQLFRSGEHQLALDRIGPIIHRGDGHRLAFLETVGIG